MLEVDGQCIWDSCAIIIYLARRFGGDAWLPLDPLAMARVMQWVVLSQNELLYGLARARGVRQMDRSGNLEEYQALGRAGLRVMESRLCEADWLACDRATIADVACYPYVAQASDSDIDTRDYPGIEAWLARVQSLPGYVKPLD